MSTCYDRLRELVVSGALEPGVPLREIPLAAELGVSRPTVREVLRRLESDGLADSDGRSLCVAHLRRAELRSALLMRASLEGLHAELAATRVAAGEVAPAQLRRLGQLADTTNRVTQAGEHGLAVLHNRAFHQSIDALAISPVSATAVDRLWDRIIVSTQRSLTLPGRAEIVDAEHRELLEAINAGHAGRAGDIARRHVRATLETTDDRQSRD